MPENRLTAIIFIVAAIVMLAALSFAIGKWSWGNNGYEIVVKFPNASGIAPNAEVKFAGAHAGKVRLVRLIPRDKEDKDPVTGTFNCVEIVCDIDASVQIGKDAYVTIKQDGFGISPKYVLLAPGADITGPVLVNNDIVQGQPPYDLADLIQPAGEALTQARQLVIQLGPVMNRLDKLSANLDASLPPLINHADSFLVNGNSILANFNTPDGKRRLNEMLDSLRVSTENLKVVSTNAKALTSTLAQKPWRVFWGGPTVPPPSEDEVLKSNKVIRLKPDVDVNNPANNNGGGMPPLPANTRP